MEGRITFRKKSYQVLFTVTSSSDLKDTKASLSWWQPGTFILWMGAKVKWRAHGHTATYGPSPSHGCPPSPGVTYYLHRQRFFSTKWHMGQSVSYNAKLRKLKLPVTFNTNYNLEITGYSICGQYYAICHEHSPCPVPMQKRKQNLYVWEATRDKRGWFHVHLAEREGSGGDLRGHRSMLSLSAWAWALAPVAISVPICTGDMKPPSPCKDSGRCMLACSKCELLLG